MELPVIDLAPYLKAASLSSSSPDDLEPELKSLCSEVSRILRETGALLVKDPRCSAEDNDRFIDMMERYFEMPDEFKRLQERSHLHYQGVSAAGNLSFGTEKQPRMSGKIVIMLDFDRTLIDDDTDRWVITNMGLTDLFNQLRPTLEWNSLMDRMLEELHLRGQTAYDIAECLMRMPLHPKTIEAIKSAHAVGCDLKVISDSNLFYIRSILEYHGIYNCFSEIISNPTIVDEDGRIKIFPYDSLDSPHGCDLCPPNLCKGRVVEQIQASVSENEWKRFIYLGDGRNDFCPTLKLGIGDHVMPRRNFPLCKRSCDNQMLVKAEVHEWGNGEELGTILLQIVHSIFNEEIRGVVTSQLKLLQSHIQPMPAASDVGVTPEGVEVPRSLVDEEMQEKLRSMPVEFQPSTPSGPDPKWRYMWRVGPRPSNTRFKELNAEPVIPDGFPEWKDTMDSWGYKMISAIEVVAEMAAIGFGLEKDAFTSLMKQGPHLLAPTGSNLGRHGQLGTVFAGYHYDLNFLTIHGRSRFPGLNIWLRTGCKVEVKVPVGCLLIQTGKQIEWLTAGDCIAGMHEVVVTNRTIDAIKLASEQNRSLWRVSSTLFAHIASDAVLKPLGHFADSPLSHKYPPIHAGEFVEQELAVINLKGSKSSNATPDSN